LETRFQINNSVDIHSENSYKFNKEILKADPLVLNVLEKGLIIHFRVYEYFEKNNKSALIHMEKFKSVISEWESKDICKKVYFKTKCWSSKLIRLHRR